MMRACICACVKELGRRTVSHLLYVYRSTCHRSELVVGATYEMGIVILFGVWTITTLLLRWLYKVCAKKFHGVASGTSVHDKKNTP
jgi:hypothetical protein